MIEILIITELSQIASMTYFVEKEASHWTFIDSFWYSLMTLTTVGNESQPNSMSGKVSSIIYLYISTIYVHTIDVHNVLQLVGGVCALLGVFILTLPLPIVVNSFSSIYKNRSEVTPHTQTVSVIDILLSVSQVVEK